MIDSLQRAVQDEIQPTIEQIAAAVPNIPRAIAPMLRAQRQPASNAETRLPTGMP
ncbi:hypothetical protein FRC03_005156 [Tulasnella sp. 419]|nr:hypothetical protein FRC02_005951 [Tulasnella sp. 418]KAG8940707.1 hypothetical protein FRC03_005156 [Tulasnella sp. 419]